MAAEKRQAVALAITGASGAIVFIEPSPYEVMSFLTLVTFVIGGMTGVLLAVPPEGGPELIRSLAAKGVVAALALVAFGATAGVPGGGGDCGGGETGGGGDPGGAAGRGGVGVGSAVDAGAAAAASRRLESSPPENSRAARRWRRR